MENYNSPGGCSLGRLAEATAGCHQDLLGRDGTEMGKAIGKGRPTITAIEILGRIIINVVGLGFVLGFGDRIMLNGARDGGITGQDHTCGQFGWCVIRSC